MSPLRRTPRPGWAQTPDGERVLAAAPSADGATWLLGTRTALVIATAEGVECLPWETIHAADWDTDEQQIRIVGVGEYDAPRPQRVLRLGEATTLLQLIRERVTASILLQRPVAVSGRRVFTVIGRRSPAGGAITWLVDYAPGVDPTEPAVAALVEQAVASAAAEAGE